MASLNPEMSQVETGDDMNVSVSSFQGFLGFSCYINKYIQISQEELNSSFPVITINLINTHCS